MSVSGRPGVRTDPALVGRHAGLLVAAVLGCAGLGGCLAAKYRQAPESTPPAQELALRRDDFPLDIALHHVIVYNGPGSWKREALWDEYVVTIANQGGEVLLIDEVALIGADGVRHLPGVDPWKLEAQSQTLEQRYKRNGLAFARSEIPDALVYGSSAVGGAAGSVFAAASSSVAAASVLGLPIYYIAVFGVDHSNKGAVRDEFMLRRLSLPRTLWPGETQTGSFFFPMTPDPRALDLRWWVGARQGVSALDLPMLHGVHGRAAAGAAP